MPYLNRNYEEYVPPEVVVEYRGVKVFHTYYPDSNIISERQNYWYAMYPQNNPEEPGGYVFDVRDLPAPEDLNMMDDRLHAKVIKQALKDKQLPLKEKTPEVLAPTPPKPADPPAPKRPRGRPKGSKNVKRK